MSIGLRCHRCLPSRRSRTLERCFETELGWQACAGGVAWWSDAQIAMAGHELSSGRDKLMRRGTSAPINVKLDRSTRPDQVFTIVLWRACIWEPARTM